VVLFTKPKAKVTIYCDKDKRLVKLFRTIRDKERLEKFQANLMFTPYSRFLRYRCLGEKDPISAFVCTQQSFGGMIDKTSWGIVIGESRRGMVASVSQYASSIESLTRFHHDLQGVKILQGDWVKTLKYDSPETLFYLDPPYVPETRRDGEYQYEMSPEAHTNLVKQVREVEGYVLLSNYNNPIYSRLEKKGWKRFDREVACMVVARTRAIGLRGGKVDSTQKRMESLWVNPRVRKWLARND
jgi:DNA adenine methylase